MPERAPLSFGPGHAVGRIPQGTVMPIAVGPAGATHALAVYKQLPDGLFQLRLVDWPLMEGPFEADRHGTVECDMLATIGRHRNGPALPSVERYDSNLFVIGTAAEVELIAGLKLIDALLNGGEWCIERAGVRIVTRAAGSRAEASLSRTASPLDWTNSRDNRDR